MYLPLFLYSDTIRLHLKIQFCIYLHFIRLHWGGSCFVGQCILHPSFIVFSPSGLTSLSYAPSCSSISQLLEEFWVKVWKILPFLTLHGGLIYCIREIHFLFTVWRKFKCAAQLTFKLKVKKKLHFYYFYSIKPMVIEDTLSGWEKKAAEWERMEGKGEAFEIKVVSRLRYWYSPQF